MYFDTHAHLDDEAFEKDRAEVLERIQSEGIALVLDPGCDRKSSRKAADLAEQNAFVWFAAGIHPGELDDFTESALEEIAKLCTHPKCRAVGEIGLDYYWDDSRKQEQKRLLQLQLELARDMSMPVIIHDREAHGDSLETVKHFEGLRGVFHCFSGSPEMAAELLKMGWYLGFDGPVTYKNARKAVEVLKICPMDRILLETDSPYLPPVPMRGRRNDPGNLAWICRKVAEVKEVSPERMAEITLRNGKELFGIPT